MAIIWLVFLSIGMYPSKQHLIIPVILAWECTHFFQQCVVCQCLNFSGLSTSWPTICFEICFEIWQAPRQQYRRGACQISERSGGCGYGSRGFETSRGLETGVLLENHRFLWQQSPMPPVAAGSALWWLLVLSVDGVECYGLGGGCGDDIPHYIKIAVVLINGFTTLYSLLFVPTDKCYPSIKVFMHVCVKWRDK